MYETNFILKAYANKKNKNNETLSVIAKVKLDKTIYGAKFFKLTFYYTTRYLTINTLLRCDLVDKSRHYYSGQDPSDKKITPTDTFLVSNYYNYSIQKTKISNSKTTINEFEVEAEFTNNARFNDEEVKNSYFQIRIYHTED